MIERASDQNCVRLSGLKEEESIQRSHVIIRHVVCLFFLTRSRPPAPMLLSTQKEVTSFIQEVAHPQLAGYKPDRVLGLFKTQTQAGRKLELLKWFK